MVNTVALVYAYLSTASDKATAILTGVGVSAVILLLITIFCYRFFRRRRLRGIYNVQFVITTTFLVIINR